ncbi:MAG TPA: hypothetical protein VEB66_15385 [Opitutaceae bacterium]|nr:hypothetical protein [Opitutaceae bacterium]
MSTTIVASGSKGAGARRRRPWRGPALLAVAVGVLTALAWPPALSEQERTMVGTWYGLDTRHPDHPYAWIAERRADRTTRMTFRRYARADSLGPTSPADAAERWQYEDRVDVGHWRVEDGIYIVDSWHEATRPSFWDGLGALLRGRPGGSGPVFHDRYRILKLAGREMVYQGDGTGRGGKAVFRAVRTDGPARFAEIPRGPDEWLKE